MGYIQFVLNPWIARETSLNHFMPSLGKINPITEVKNRGLANIDQKSLLES